MKRALACAVVLAAGSTAWGMDLSGTWMTQIAFASGAASPTTAFTLDLAGSGWQLTSSWDPAFLETSSHTLVLKSNLGLMNITAGASFCLSTRTALARVGTPDDLALWSAGAFTFRSGFVSFELALGNLTLRLTLHRGPAE